MNFFDYSIPQKNKILHSKLFWVSLLYFSEGFPLGIFYDIFPVYFRQEGISLNNIGLLSLLGLSWTLKFLWAPAIDFSRNHRLWMVTADIVMGLTILIFAYESGLGAWVWIAIAVFTFFSATKDIAIDGYTIEKLNKNELGIANGFRIAFYRVGMIAAGLILWLSDHVGWKLTFLFLSLTTYLVL